ncbi:transmembrane anchored protein [Klebsiella variicola]
MLDLEAEINDILEEATQAFAGNCQHPDDTAADGSRCGGRSADSRPGGQ